MGMGGGGGGGGGWMGWLATPLDLIFVLWIGSIIIIYSEKFSRPKIFRDGSIICNFNFVKYTQHL